MSVQPLLGPAVQLTDVDRVVILGAALNGGIVRPLYPQARQEQIEKRLTALGMITNEQHVNEARPRLRLTTQGWYEGNRLSTFAWKRWTPDDRY